jgi:predicted RNA methylase
MSIMALSINRRRALGQYFTPDPVVTTCYGFIDGALPPRPRIVDPACGDGAFLRYAAAHHLAAPSDLHGCEVDPALVAALHTAGLAQIRQADGLAPASLPDATFDLVVGNPPYGVATARDGQALASESRFLLRAVELARPGGLIALVLPSGVLANERLCPLRANLLRHMIVAVVELPRDTFRQAGTSAACSLFLLHRAPPPPGHRVFFGIAPRLSDLPALVDAFHRRSQESEARSRETKRQGDKETGRHGKPGSSGDPRDRPEYRGARETGLTDADTVAKLLPACTEWYWLEQGAGLAERLDARYWRPACRELLERLGARWSLRELGEIVGRQGVIVGDHVRPSRGERKGPGLAYEYYQTREFLPSGYNYVQIEHCNEQAYQRLRYTAVQQGDILVSCAGIGGAGRARVCLVTHSPGRSCTGDVFILRAASLDPAYLFLFLTSCGGREQLLRLQNGVSTANLSASELLRVQVPFLPPARQRALAAAFAPAAEAHHAAMGALARRDTAGYTFEQARAEALRAGLLARLEQTLLI